MSAASASAIVATAVRKIRKAGIHGQRPLDEIELLDGIGAAAEDAMRQALAEASGDELTAAVHLVRLMRAADLATDVADAALRRPATMDAKIEAVEALREWGIPVPSSVEATLDLFDRVCKQPLAEDLARVRELPEAWRLPVLNAMLDSPAGANAEHLTAILGIDPGLDARVVEALGRSASPDAVEPLRRIESSGDRALKKPAKRALHRLRSQGVEIFDAAGAAEPVRFSLAITPDTKRETQAYTTGVDGAGTRILWVLSPSSQGGERLLEAVIDDLTGLRRAEVMSVTRRGFRQHVERLRSNASLLIVQADATEVAAQLLAAEASSKEHGAEVPASFAVFRDTIAPDLFAGAVGVQPRDPIPQQARDGIAGDRELLAASAELLSLPFFSNWALHGARVEAAAREVRQAETSRLALDDEQRKQQVDRAISGAADALDAEVRARYRARLERMAAVLWVAKRSDQARQALAAAAGFDEIDELYSDHPFARGLIQRGVLVAYQHLREHEETEDSDSGRIVEP